MALSPEHVGLNSFLNDLNSNPLYVAAGNERLKLIEQKAQNEPTPENYLNLSLEYYNLQRYEDCIKASYKAIELKPGYELAYNNICSAYNSMQKWDEAIAAGEQGLKLNPNYQLLKNNLAVSKAGKAKSGK